MTVFRAVVLASVVQLVQTVLMPGTAEAGTPTFIPLGYATPDAFESVANDVSADGSVVVGVSTSESDRGEYLYAGFRWTSSGGLQLIDGYLDPYLETTAYGVSPDGEWVVGIASHGGDGNAYRWSQATGLQVLPDLSGTFDLGSASAASIGAAIVTGYGVNEFDHQAAAYWNSAGEVNPIGDYENASGGATDVSADGSIIVGARYLDGVGSEAFRWTLDGGYQVLGPVSSQNGARAESISLDGTTIVGTLLSNASSRGFQWTESTGIVELPSLPNHAYTDAVAVSGDGAVVVGSTSSDFGPEGVIWHHGKVEVLQEKLINQFDLGAQLSGWQLTYPQSISADGTTIVGYGLNPAGQLEAWVVTIPEPTTLELSCVGASLLVAAAIHRTSLGRKLW